MAPPSSTSLKCCTRPPKWSVRLQLILEQPVPCPHRLLLSFSFYLSPAQLVQLSKAQDVEAGDGTTSVVVIAGSLLTACEHLLAKGIHPSIISSSFQHAAAKATEILEGVSRWCSSLHQLCFAISHKGTFYLTSFLISSSPLFGVIPSFSHPQMSTPVELTDRESLLKSASTSLNSKVVSLYSNVIAPIVVDAVMAVADTDIGSVDLNDIKIIRKLG